MMKSKPVIQITKNEVILMAAIRLFLDKGYASTTMDNIAKAAGFTKQTVYSYFPSKDILFTQMIVYLCERPSTYKAQIYKGKATFANLLYAHGSALLSLITEPDVLATTRLVISESDRYPEIAKLYYESGTQRLVRATAHFLDECNAKKLVNIPNTESAASYFLAMLKGQYYVRMILGIKPAPSQKNKDAHVRETVSLFVKLYASGAPLKTKSIL
jgi:AcrR family transcriptional regulator